MSEQYRIERDTMGEVKVPAEVYWGAQTERSRNNFKIGPEASMPKDIIQAFAFLKKAAARTNSELGVLPKDKADLIAAVCDEILAGMLDDQFPLVIWQTGSGTQSNMNVNEVISNRAHVLKGGSLLDELKTLHPNDDVNKSQSSNDTFPTAMNIAAYLQIKKQLLPALKDLIIAFEAKQLEFVELIKTGRTHLMDATPLTLGQEFSAYVHQLKRGYTSLNSASEELLELALGGTAVGTGLNSPNGYADLVAQNIAHLTGENFVSAPNKFASLAAHDDLVSVSGSMKRLATALIKIANDIRFMASGPRSGIGELQIPDNEPGSSIMPGKVNPTQIEALIMVCTQVVGNDTAVAMGNSMGQMQLNVLKPLIISNVLNSGHLLADAMLSFRINCVEGITANKENIDQHLKKSLMLVTALNTHIGYNKAAEIAKNAYKKGITLRDSAIELGYVNGDDFDKWVDPSKMI